MSKGGAPILKEQAVPEKREPSLRRLPHSDIRRFSSSAISALGLFQHRRWQQPWHRAADVDATSRQQMVAKYWMKIPHVRPAWKVDCAQAHYSNEGDPGRWLVRSHPPTCRVATTDSARVQADAMLVMRLYRDARNTVASLAASSLGKKRCAPRANTSP